MKKVLIWAEHAFQLYSVKPVADKYVRQGCDVHLMTEFEDAGLCASYLGLPLANVHKVREHRRRWQSRLIKLYEAAFVGLDYSMVYASHQKGEAGLRKFLRGLGFLKLRKEDVNRCFHLLARLTGWLGNRGVPGDYDLLITYTKVYHVLLLPRGVPHISIMESWDHPIKLPYFTQPDYCLTWNSDLADDTRRTQFLDRVARIAPLKFRYIGEREGRGDDELVGSLRDAAHRAEILRLAELRKRGRVILYPTTTSSAGIEHEGEMRLIGDICAALEGTGDVLYIKPKPNGPRGDYDRFAAFPHVFVGAYSKSPDSRDMLDEDYHTFRYLILRNTDIAINAGTTFVLEAALMGRPVVQLDLEEGRYGGFARFTKTYHLSKYILSLPGCTRFGGDPSVLRQALAQPGMALSEAMRRWITWWR